MLRCKLQGIGEQVVQNLLQPVSVCQQVLRQPAVTMYVKAQLLGLRLLLKPAIQMAADIMQRNRLQHRRHFTDFKLGQIQNLINQLQQVFTCREDSMHIF
ncbi:hypothetical protein D3C80_1575030 [compost metagenome]